MSKKKTPKDKEDRLGLGFILAFVIHAVGILFGGLLFYTDEEKAALVAKEETVEIETEEPKKEQEPEEAKEKEEEETPAETPDEMPQLVQSSEPSNAAPELAAMSMADLEASLGGAGGEGGFGPPGGLGSGVIGGTGNPGGGGDALSASQLDQKPKLVTRVDPKPPKNLIKSLPQLTVTVYMDASGNVTKVEISPQVDTGVQKAIVDAVRRWKYEPGSRNGQKVGCKVSHKMSFNG